MTTPLRSPLSVCRLEPRETPAVGYTAFGAAPGGLPLVEVQRADGTAVARFAAFDPAFRGGVRAAVAELDGNQTTVEVVVGAGPGGGPHVRAYRIDPAANNAVTRIADFFPFDAGFTGGVRVAAGNLGGPDNRDEIVVAADAGGGPHVKVFGLDRNGTVANIAGPLGNFFAFEAGFRGGVRVAAGELDGNASNGDELVVTAGRNGGPRVKVYRTDGVVLADYFTYRPDFRGGVNVTITEPFLFGQTVFDARSDDPSQRGITLNSLATSSPANTVGNTVTNLITGGFPLGTGVTVSTGVGVSIGSTTGTAVAPNTTDPETLQRFGDPGPVIVRPALLGPPYIGRFSGVSIAVPIVVLG